MAQSAQAYDLVIRGGRVAGPTQGLDAVLMSDPRGQGGRRGAGADVSRATRVVDATGKLVAGS